jgi:hypothetical protein
VLHPCTVGKAIGQKERETFLLALLLLLKIIKRVLKHFPFYADNCRPSSVNCIRNLTPIPTVHRPLFPIRTAKIGKLFKIAYFHFLNCRTMMLADHPQAIV